MFLRMELQWNQQDAAWPLHCDVVWRRRENARQPMEAMVTAAANIEIFIATLAVAACLARLALRGMFWLMQDAGAGAGRHFSVQRATAASAGNGQAPLQVR
jgi:hypothetical protein